MQLAEAATHAEELARSAGAERELAILRYLPTIMSNREIARQLYVSVNTVKTHLKQIYRKLGVSNRTEAARYAFEQGLIAHE